VTKDLADFLESLNREGVAYVVIGGIAVLAHIPYRTTRDLDVLIEPTLDNAEKARRAVAAWGSFDPEYEPADFISGDILSFGGCCASRSTAVFPAWIGKTFGTAEWRASSLACRHRSPVG
jgi:hypothetical protein